MAVENLNGPKGLARIDAIARGEELAPPVAMVQLIAQVIPANPSRRELRAIKMSTPALQAEAGAKLGQ